MEQSNFSKHTNTNWRFRREQAQADINHFVGYLKHYEDVKCQIRFLKRCLRSRMIPKGLGSSLASMQHSSKSGFRFCKRIQFRLLRRTIRDKYELLSEIDNKIRIYDWNVKTFKLGSRFYHNFYAYARKYAMKVFNKCERRLQQKFYYLSMEMLTNKMEDCEMDIVKQAESHKRKVVWNLSVLISHLKLKNYL